MRLIIPKDIGVYFTKESSPSKATHFWNVVDRFSDRGVCCRYKIEGGEYTMIVFAQDIVLEEADMNEFMPNELGLLFKFGIEYKKTQGNEFSFYITF